MSRQDFTALVDLAMRDSSLTLMRPVVEKELLHYEIFAALDGANLLRNLVFQGGTSLRLCRGSDRFSEDLDFAGGKTFTADQMENIETCLVTHIGKRFGLPVTVKPPKHAGRSQSGVSVDQWWLTITVASGNAAMPSQKIKLEVANVPAYTREPVVLLSNYEFMGGMKRTLVNTESLSEVLADKIVAFPTSLFDQQGLPVPVDSNKIRYRDLWDIAWLIQKRAVFDPDLVQQKLLDYGIEQTYPPMLEHAFSTLPAIIEGRAFQNQMRRFLSIDTFQATLAQAPFLNYLVATVAQQFSDLQQHRSSDDSPRWKC